MSLFKRYAGDSELSSQTLSLHPRSCSHYEDPSPRRGYPEYSIAGTGTARMSAVGGAVDDLLRVRLHDFAALLEGEWIQGGAQLPTPRGPVGIELD